MTQHLTREQIWDCLIGDSPARSHTHECDFCRSELVRFESTLMEFRGAVRDWSERTERSQTLVCSRIISTTIPSRGIYGGNEIKAGLSSILVNAAIVSALLIAGTVAPIQTKLTQFIPLIAPDLRTLKPKQEIAKGGGAGAQETDVTKGKLPKVAPRQFMPLVHPVDQPKLSMPAAILAPELPTISSQNIGDPLAGVGIPSTGRGPSIGIGPGKGPGIGPGTGAGFGGEAYRPGGGVTAPVAITKPEPEYSDEARKAKWQGAVTLQLVVDEMGRPQNIQVTKPLGMGLDEKAVEAVMKWRFKPGMKDGKPVPVIAIIEVSFRLL